MQSVHVRVYQFLQSLIHSFITFRTLIFSLFSALHVFDALSGRELNEGRLFQHKNEIDWVCISQSGSHSQRVLAFIDKNCDLYLSSIREGGNAVLLG